MDRRCKATAALGLLLALLAAGASARAAAEDAVVTLVGTAELGPGPARENSGIVASRHHDDTFWMINDSGDAPRVYAVRRDGSVHGAARGSADYVAASPHAGADGYEVPGVLIAGAINVDWEDIALDSRRRLLVPDFGNNSNARRDLVIYVLDEPAPSAGRTTWRQRWFFRYPEQTAFPAPEDDFNYDAEALFTVGDTTWILTKHRSDTRTRLYRLPEPAPGQVAEAVLTDSFDVGGRVTAADASTDGLRLLVATYDTLWLFERATPSEPFFSAPARRLRFEAQQVEAACFLDVEATTVLLADERTALLHELAVADFEPVPAAELAQRREVSNR